MGCTSARLYSAARTGLLRRLWILPALAGLFTAPGIAAAVQRFPRPEFATDYVTPELEVPVARALSLEYLDVAVLFAALVLASWLALRRRSRRGLLWLTVFSLAYFGFWRQGCVCAVGSSQNVALGWADPTYAIPVTVLLFFGLPLVFALFTGRTFCAAVCPLGAIQELMVWRPRKLPAWLNHVLGTLPWIYLGVALLFAATGTGFLICRWDPYVGFFRFGATMPMLLFGAGLLILGLFVARPYCRFLCPYGVLLGAASRLAYRHVSITPSECIQCRLCEDACPYDAIRPPVKPAVPEPRARGVRRLALILVLLPLSAAAAAGTGRLFGRVLSTANRHVALALEVQRAGTDEEMSLEREAFFTSGLPAGELYARARHVQRTFAAGGAVLGGALAVLASLKLLGLSLVRSRKDYEPDRAQCVSCARCFAYCPVERDAVRPPTAAFFHPDADAGDREA